MGFVMYSTIVSFRLFLLALFAASTMPLCAQSPAPDRQEQSSPRQAPPPTSSGSSPNSMSMAALSAPSGYVLGPNDLVAVEVFGEEDLRTNGRLNGEGNLSVPLI